MLLLIVIIVLVLYMLYRNYELFNETVSEIAEDNKPSFKKVCECRLNLNHSSPQHNYPNELKRKYYDYHIGLNNENELYSFVNNNQTTNAGNNVCN